LLQRWCYRKGGDVTRAGVRGYVEAVRGRYSLASKEKDDKIRTSL